jgi:hypothetical protein
MMGSCPRCSVQVAGWLYCEGPLVICLSCGAVIRGMITKRIISMNMNTKAGNLLSIKSIRSVIGTKGSL